MPRKRPLRSGSTGAVRERSRVAFPALCDTSAELGLDAQQYGLVLPVDGRDRFEGENKSPSEQSSAHDELVGIVGVAFVVNVIEAREGGRPSSSRTR
jgi:hypothetical protein